MTRLRMAVIGCGHLGRIHARLLSQNPHADLIGVVDPQHAARQAVADELGVAAQADYRALIPEIDAAIIAAPTGQHAEIARPLLDAGVDLLVEKPLTATARDAQKLADYACQLRRVLAVGHVERFNPAFVAIEGQIERAQFIEAARCSGFTFRSTDVGVVMDLMIHDLELILALVGSPVRSVESWGHRLISQHEDLALARLVFENGCIAQCKASRISPAAERTLHVFDGQRQLTVDFAARSARIVRPSRPLERGPLDIAALSQAEIQTLRQHVFSQLLPTTELPIADTNPLADEQQDFIESVQQRRRPRVDGAAAAEAVRVAEEIVANLALRPRPRLHRPAA